MTDTLDRAELAVDVLTPPQAPLQAPLPIRSMDEILSELGRRAVPTADVEIPEWGATVRVRGLTRGELLHIQAVATDRGRRSVDPAVMDRESFLLAVVEPKWTAAHYILLKNRSDATPILARIEAKIGELTNGAPVQGPDGKEVDAVSAAYFPAGGSFTAVGNGSAERRE